MLRRVAAAVLIAWGLGAGLADASSVIFSNFGPGDAFDLFNGHGVTSPMFVESDVAEGFVPQATYTLDAIRLAADLELGSGNELDIALAADDGGHPGATLESFVLSVTGVPTILTASSVLHPTLSANTLYWITAEVPDLPGEFVGWFANSTGGVGPTASRPASPPLWFVFNETQSVFEVTGSPIVPEPASLTLVGLGVVGFVARTRHRPSPVKSISVGSVPVCGELPVVPQRRLN